jgi:hypothetical protein
MSPPNKEPSSDVACWRGWPPQVWNGKNWVYIPVASLIVRLTAELLKLRKEKENWMQERRSVS